MTAFDDTRHHRGEAAPHELRDEAWLSAFRAAQRATNPAAAAAYPVAAEHGFVLPWPLVESLGVLPACVRRELHSGRWCRPRRGIISVLSRSAVGSIGDHATLQLGALAAAAARPETAISHESAAAVYALPILRPPVRPSLTTLGRSAGGEGLPPSVVRGARLSGAEVGTWFGAPVTTPARTVVDIARLSGRRAGLVAADAALHYGLIAPGDLQLATQDRVRWPGIRAAREVAQLADGRAESALETLLRLLALDFGLPSPVPQLWVETTARRYRVDLGWPKRHVAAEADGAMKYRAGVDALWREKRRQEDIERAGWTVVRATWADVTREPEQTAQRIAAALFRRR